MRRRLILGAWALFAGQAMAGALTVCTEASPDGFDIAQSTSAVTHDAVGNTIHDQLITYKRGTADLVPGLATSWDVSADGLQFTVHLRPGVKFHTTAWFKPTRDFDADDVLFSIHRMADPKGPWQQMATNGYVMWAGSGMQAAMKSVEKIDAMTVRFTLNQPTAPFATYLAYTQTGSM